MEPSPNNFWGPYRILVPYLDDGRVHAEDVVLVENYVSDRQSVQVVLDSERLVRPQVVEQDLPRGRAHAKTQGPLELQGRHTREPRQAGTK